MKTKKIFQIVVGVLSVAGMAPQAYAITGCTTNTLTGPYGLQFSGMVTPALAGGVAGTVTPASLLQQITSDPPAVGYAQVFLDGGGNLFGNSAVNLNGMWSEGPVSGTYTVTSDCQVSFLITDSSGGTQHFNGIVVSQGEAGVLLQTDPWRLGCAQTSERRLPAFGSRRYLRPAYERDDPCFRRDEFHWNYRAGWARWSNCGRVDFYRRRSGPGSLKWNFLDQPRLHRNRQPWLGD